MHRHLQGSGQAPGRAVLGGVINAFCQRQKTSLLGKRALRCTKALYRQPKSSSSARSPQGCLRPVGRRPEVWPPYAWMGSGPSPLRFSAAGRAVGPCPYGPADRLISVLPSSFLPSRSIFISLHSPRQGRLHEKNASFVRSTNEAFFLVTRTGLEPMLPP